MLQPRFWRCLGLLSLNGWDPVKSPKIGASCEAMCVDLITPVLADLENHDAVIEVDRRGSVSKPASCECSTSVFSVNLVDAAFCALDERAFSAQATTMIVPIGSMKIFD